MARQSNKHKEKPRKSNQSKRLANPRKPDVKACKSLAICGHVRAEYIESIWSDRRIRTFMEEGIIEKVSYGTKKGEVIAYKLTPRGVNYAKKYIIPDYQIYSSRSICHDVYMSDHYFTKMSDTERETIKTETEIKSEWKEMVANEDERIDAPQDYSCVDFMYKSDSGEMIGFEVITENYTEADIQAKRNFCSAYGCTYTQSVAKTGGAK